MQDYRLLRSFYSLAMTRWWKFHYCPAFCHCEKSFSFSWQSTLSTALLRDSTCGIVAIY
ncbi:hypothetical protein [Helicobacter rodentium]|nr:hypothetical protein [Helicobacter rodentium]